MIAHAVQIGHIKPASLGLIPITEHAGREGK